MSININAEFTFAFGEAPLGDRIMQLIDLHLQELVAANAGASDKMGVEINGRADLSQMVWIGHSRGGDYVNWIVRNHHLDETASPVGYGPVQGMIVLAPPILAIDTLPAVDVQNITEIAILFDQTPSGALFVADLELLESGME